VWSRAAAATGHSLERRTVVHLSKKALYIGIIAYSIALLVFQDWYYQNILTGTLSFIFLGKMGVDLAFAGAALVRLVGPALFAEDEGEDEMAIHEEDLHFSDTALYGFFFANVLGNAGWHAYVTSMTTGGQSFVASIWCIAEFVILFFTWVLWKHALTVQKRQARAAKAKAAGGVRAA
jgi:hypothetical protein